MKPRQRARLGQWVTDVGDDELLREELDATLDCDVAGIATVDGQTGTGKTEAVCRWASEQGIPTLYVQVDENEQHSINIDDLLYRELAAHGDADMEQVRKLRPVDRKHLLTDLLAEKPRIVITDEAGTASRGTLTRLRTMNDRRDAEWTWIIVGQDCVEHMCRLGLAPNGNRLIGDHTSEGLTGDDLTNYLRQFHPAFRDSGLEDLLHSVDERLAEKRPGGRGNRRSWDTFAYRLERAFPGETLTEEAAAHILGGMRPWERPR